MYTDLPDSVLILTTSDFNYILRKHEFIAVLFFNSRSVYCHNFTFQFERTAQLLDKENQSIPLGFVDISKDACKHIGMYYKAWGTPTFLIFKNYGTEVEEYKGPLIAEGFIECLKRLRGDLPTEIESIKYVDDHRMGDKPIMIVGYFPEFSGQEYENFIKVADKFKWVDYLFRITKHNTGPRCFPLVSLFLPDPYKEDEQICYVTDDFRVHELVKFVEDKTTPVVIQYGVAPELLVYNFFHSDCEKDKAMLFINRGSEDAKAIEDEYRKVAEKYRGKDISFMFGEIEASKRAFKFFGASSIIYNGIVIRDPWGGIFAKFHVEADDIETWVDDYKAHRVTEYEKSEKVPEENNELVKVIVGGNFKKEVMDTDKNVLLELYRSTSGSFKSYDEMLNKVASHYEDDDNVIIAKVDVTANDIRSNYACELRTVGDEPALYFVTAEDVDLYEGPIDHVDVIKYIEENRDPSVKRTRTE